MCPSSPVPSPPCRPVVVVTAPSQHRSIVLTTSCSFIPSSQVTAPSRAQSSSSRSSPSSPPVLPRCRIRPLHVPVPPAPSPMGEPLPSATSRVLSSSSSSLAWGASLFRSAGALFVTLFGTLEPSPSCAARAVGRPCRRSWPRQASSVPLQAAPVPVMMAACADGGLVSIPWWGHHLPRVEVSSALVQVGRACGKVVGEALVSS